MTQKACPGNGGCHEMSSQVHREEVGGSRSGSRMWRGTSTPTSSDLLFVRKGGRQVSLGKFCYYHFRIRLLGLRKVKSLA